MRLKIRCCLSPKRQLSRHPFRRVLIGLKSWHKSGLLVSISVVRISTAPLRDINFTAVYGAPLVANRHNPKIAKTIDFDGNPPTITTTYSNRNPSCPIQLPRTCEFKHSNKLRSRFTASILAYASLACRGSRVKILGVGVSPS